MRIAIVTETYPPEINGVARTVRGFVDGARDLGHEVTVLRPRQDRDPDASDVRAILTRAVPIPRYPELRMGLARASTLAARWRAQRPDAVYIATEGPLGWAALRAARRLGLPVGTGFHTRFDQYLHHYGVGFLAGVARAVLRRFHNRAGATLVPTAALQRELTALGFERVHRLGRGVDAALFSPERRDPALRESWGLESDGLAVLHLGRLAAEKNLELAIRAFEAIRARRPKARMVWIGDGPQRERLERSRPDDVFCGMRRGEALAQCVASGDLFLFPSLTETFGNVTLEAMASGVATVAFDYGAAGEHLSAPMRGRIAPFGDEAAFIELASSLAIDDELRGRLALACRDAIAGLTPARIAAEFVGILDSLRSPRPQAATAEAVS